MPGQPWQKTSRSGEHGSFCRELLVDERGGDIVSNVFATMIKLDVFCFLFGISVLTVTGLRMLLQARAFVNISKEMLQSLRYVFVRRI